ncbi:DUF308 domain-containing protein [Bifidobacterium sp.]|uniref:DUF308 domain-containing protein n=1 Tax=Bifidobacterium sp. TaxID=41200 RepID=UPI0025C1C546|nr:DUF308 domain-containing protein [Bifidobacterium sp.]MCI1635495.1 DUF308 domain-containing protein [Bifidobacterium sp.]
MSWQFRKNDDKHNNRRMIDTDAAIRTTSSNSTLPHAAVTSSDTRGSANIFDTKPDDSQQIGNTATTQFPVTQQIQPVPAQTAVLPPNVPPYAPSNPPAASQLPWSKLIIAACILGIIGLVFSFTPAAALGALAGFIAFFLGIAGLLLIAIRKNRKNILAAILSIVLSLVSFIAGAVNTPETTSAESHSTSKISDEEASQSAEAAAASASASASRSAEAQKKADENAAKLTDAKTTLASAINDANTLLTSSNNNVADSQTRTALTEAINTANAVSSDDPQSYIDAVTPLQQTMDAVNASVEQKKQNDAAAAQKAAEQKAAEAQKVAEQQAAAQKAAQQKAAADAAAAQKAQQQQQQQQQSGSGSLIAVCKDGTRSASAPGAPNYRGMCSHHGGIAQKLGRQ